MAERDHCHIDDAHRTRLIDVPLALARGRRRDPGPAAATLIAAAGQGSARRRRPRRRHAGAERAMTWPAPPGNRSIVRIETNVLSINAAPRGALGLAAIASAIVIGANKPCDAPARR